MAFGNRIRPAWALATLLLVSCSSVDKLGQRPDGSALVTTGQVVLPEGKTAGLPSRPVDVVVSADGRTAYAKDNRGLVVLDVAEAKVTGQVATAGGTSLHGIALTPNGAVLLSGAGNAVHEIDPAAGKILRSLTMPAPKVGGQPYPLGIAINRAGTYAAVALSRSNTIAWVNLETGKVDREIPCDICPYAVAFTRDESRLLVTCWGGEVPQASDKQAPSSGTPVEVDERGVGKSATLQCFNLADGKQVYRQEVGRHPVDIAMTRDGKTAYIACANDDTVAVADVTTGEIRTKLDVRPESDLLFGMQPNAVALSPDERTLYVPLGRMNAVAVWSVGGQNRLRGLIPAGWYPGSVAVAGNRVVVANTRGTGSRGPVASGATGRGVYAFTGSLSVFEPPRDSALAGLTRRALTMARSPQARESLRKGDQSKAPVPIPARLGEPSTIEHVVYIIKENRTYDQLFGDLPQGDGDPSLCQFPRTIAPNHHALAEQFVLLDNYYCSGVLSADGHAWATEGTASDFLEKSFGGWTRSYPFGDDPLSYASTGFIWDAFLDAGLTFRNYGEMDYAEPSPASSFKQVYDDFINKTGKITFTQKIGIERLRRFSAPNYPGWNMGIPDVLRADRFLKEFEEFKKKGEFPNFTIIYFPQDHFSGRQANMPTPRAHMADNDLALGRVVEALSNSPFWRKMAIFVNEDDPQNGFDHVDGHRSICLVVSPFAKRGAVVSEFYHQSSVLHTITRIFGLKPINHVAALSDVMSACFSSTADFRPYRALPATVPLDELNPPASALSGEDRYWALESDKIDLRRPDGQDELKNRVLWSLNKGVPFPADRVGAHGRGLAERGLKLTPGGVARR